MRALWFFEIYMGMVVLCGCAEQEASPEHGSDRSEGSGSRLAQVVLIVTSESCACTLEECRDLETYLSAAVEGRSISFQTIDYARDWPRANSLLNTYGLQFIPAVIVLDEKGTELFKADSPIDMAALSRALE